MKPGKITAATLPLFAGPAWQQIDGYCQTSGTHNVAKSYVSESPRYTAWRLRGASGRSVCLGVFDTAEEARACCERDAGE